MRFIVGLLLIFSVTLAYAATSNVKQASNKQLIFFFDSTCPYCQKMAPIIVRVAKKYNLSVIGNSMDGKPIAGFPDAIYDDKLAEEFKIERLPTIGGVDKRTNQITVVAIGLHDEPWLESAVEKWLWQESTSKVADIHRSTVNPI